MRYTVEKMSLSDVAVTRDAQWILCIGTVLADSAKVHEERSRMNQLVREFVSHLYIYYLIPDRIHCTKHSL